MRPSYWGKEGWHFLNVVAFRYPLNPTKKDMNEYAAFFNSLRTVLPCPECAAHLSEVMQEHPVENYLDCRASLVKWVYLQHDAVNKQIGKESVTLEEFIETYKNLKDPHWRISKPSSNNNMVIALGAFVAFLLFLALRGRKVGGGAINL